MKKIVSALGFLLGAWLVCASSFAATTAGATLSANGRETYSAPRLHVSPPASFMEEAKKNVIYSTFNSDESNLYDCCLAWTVSTTQSVLGFQQFLAMPFTPAKSGKVKSIELGLSYFEGTNSLSVALAKDKGGLPGKTMKSFTVMDIPPGGSCCDIESVGPGTKVKAGVQYWVVVTASADTWGGWNEDTTNMSGNFAFDPGTGWTLTSGTLGAFRVLGK